MAACVPSGVGSGREGAAAARVKMSDRKFKCTEDLLDYCLCSSKKLLHLRVQGHCPFVVESPVETFKTHPALGGSA